MTIMQSTFLVFLKNNCIGGNMQMYQIFFILREKTLRNNSQKPNLPLLQNLLNRNGRVGERLLINL
jgi:hypothetical protein